MAHLFCGPRQELWSGSRYKVDRHIDKGKWALVALSQLCLLFMNPRPTKSLCGAWEQPPGCQNHTSSAGLPHPAPTPNVMDTLGTTSNSALSAEVIGWFARLARLPTNLGEDHPCFSLIL